MENKQVFIVIGVLAIILLAILAIKLNNQPKNAPVAVDNTNTGEYSTSTYVESPVAATPIATSSTPIKTEVPKNIIVPTQNDKTLTVEQQKVIAVPDLVTPAAPGSGSSLRNFTIKGEGGKFTPSQIAGRVGDTMLVNFTAVDKDYSIVFPSYNMRQIAKKGETKTLGFHAGESGNFLYYCDVCGDNTTATGTLVIVK